MTDPVSRSLIPSVAPMARAADPQPAVWDLGPSTAPIDTVVARARAGLAGTALADRVTPETLAALFRLAPDGSLALDDRGQASLKDPGAATAEDNVIAGAVRNALMEGEARTIGGDQAFLDAVTGYRRVELGGGLHTYVGKDGQGAPAGSAVWQLGPTLDAHRRAGLLEGEVTRAWFDDWARGAAAAGAPPPEAWEARALAWFDKPERTLGQG